VLLLQEILNIGFDNEEANAGGVCVELRPGDTTVEVFNQDACEGDLRLAPVVTGSISYGTFSHNHFNQNLKNIEGRAQANIPAVCDGQGKLPLKKLRSVSEKFGEAVDKGLLWEVLSSRIESEEPQALNVVQATLNAKNGLFMLAHEMQALATLSSASSVLAVAGCAVTRPMAREKLMETMPEFANDEGILDAFRFVIDMGGNAAPFLPDLRALHDKFVDPKLCRLRLSALARVNALPFAMPLTKVAAIKHA